jgi:ribonuclease HI
LKEVSVYTDGACLGNPGPGGYGVVIDYDGHQKELSAGFRLTTNNRMELLAAIKGLTALTEPCKVKLTSDSNYVVHAVERGWIKNWIKNGWLTAAKKPVSNRDLWLEFVDAMKRHDVKLLWVRGHTGHPQNERCDQLAVAAAKSSTLAIDAGYVANK